MEQYAVSRTPAKWHPLYKLCPEAKHPLELVEADLLTADCWLPAVKDCQYVIHIASPIPLGNPEHEDEVIKPAVDGTVNVLRACHATSTVKRVVITSSAAAMYSFTCDDDYIMTEADWTNVDEVKIVYMKSKTLAERAAWDYHGQLPETERFELSVVNPSYVLGPVLCGTYSPVMEVPKRLLNREMPLLPKLSFRIMDVRDVAAAHLAAMTVPEAAGHRHIISGKPLWIADIAKIVDAEFRPQGYKVPTTVAPYALLWLYSWFDKTIRMMLPSVGRIHKVDTSRMRNVLNITQRDVRETVLDMCYSMIEQGFIAKTSKYTGPKSAGT